MQTTVSSTPATLFPSTSIHPIRLSKTWPPYAPHSTVEATCPISTVAEDEFAFVGSQYGDPPTSSTSNDGPSEADERVAQSSFKDKVFASRRKLASQFRDHASAAHVDQDSTANGSFFRNLDIQDALLQWLYSWHWHSIAANSVNAWPTFIEWLNCQWECAFNLHEQIHNWFGWLQRYRPCRLQQVVVNQIWHRFRRRQNCLPLRIWMATCVIGEMEFEAMADQGSGRNILSPETAKLLKREGYLILPSRVRLQLPNGQSVMSGGQMRLPFHFPDGEKLDKPQKFEVLRGSIYDVILGNTLLQKTKTFTKNRHRLTSVLISGDDVKRCSYLAEVHTLVMGFIDGKPSLGVPDTGSNVPLMSKAEAGRLELTVVTDPAYQVTIQFANGDTATTEGVVLDTDVGFHFAKTYERIDWFILSSLPVPIIFCNSITSDADFWYRTRNSAHMIGSAIPNPDQSAEEARLLQQQVLHGHPMKEEVLQHGAGLFFLVRYRKAWYRLGRARASQQPLAVALAADVADTAIQDEKCRESERQLRAEREMEDAKPEDRALLHAAEEERRRIYEQRQAPVLQGNQAPPNNPQAP